MLKMNLSGNFKQYRYMKKILDISVVVIALFVAIGCSTAPVEEVPATKTSITASFADSRTALSDGVKTVWSAGDKLRSMA